MLSHFEKTLLQTGNMDVKYFRCLNEEERIPFMVGIIQNPDCFPLEEFLSMFNYSLPKKPQEEDICNQLVLAVRMLIEFSKWTKREQSSPYFPTIDAYLQRMSSEL